MKADISLNMRSTALVPACTTPVMIATSTSVPTIRGQPNMVAASSPAAAPNTASTTTISAR